MNKEKRTMEDVQEGRQTGVTCSSINKTFAVVQKYLAATVFVCYYPRRTEGTILSTNQRRV